LETSPKIKTEIDRIKKPVIYTCKKEDFDNSHFDTNHYPHIVYENLEELKEKLKFKISAWID